MQKTKIKKIIVLLLLPVLLFNMSFNFVWAGTSFTKSSIATPVSVANGGTGLTSVTQGYVLYASGTNTIAATASLFIQSSGNIGIGTTTAQYGKLVVSPTAGNSATGITLDDGTNATARSWIGTGDLWHMTRGSVATNGITIDTNGNVGIGTTAPGAKLQVEGDAAFGTGATVLPTTHVNHEFIFLGSNAIGSINSAASEIQISSNSYIDAPGSRRYTTTKPATMYEQTAGYHAWYYKGSGTAGDLVNFTEAMRIDTSGNVGIGTTAPGAKLEVTGSVAVQSGSTSDIYYGTSNNYYNFRTSAQRTANAWTVSSGGIDTNAIDDTYTDAILTVSATPPHVLIKSGFKLGIGTTSPVAMLSVRSTGTTDLLNLVETDGEEVFTVLEGGNVGIGTTAPGYKLEIAGTGINAGIHMSKTDATTASWYLHPGRLGNGEFSIGNDSIYTMVIQTNGNVGIGTTAPNAQLELNGTSALIRLHYPAMDTGTVGIEFQHRTANDVPPKTAILSTGVDSWGRSELAFVVDSNGDAGQYSAAADTKMIIKNNGNVGIGTTAPGAKLDVEGGILIGKGDHPGFAADHLAMDFSTTYDAARIQAGAGSENLLLQPSGGNVGIGTTGPAAKLDVVGGTGTAPATSGTTHNGTFRLRTSDNAVLDMGIVGGGLGAWLQSTDQRDLATNYPLLLNPNGGNVGIGTTAPGYTLTVAGTAWVTSGAWSGSDRRWKKDIVPLASSLDKINQLQGVSYNWRTDEFPEMNFGTSTQLGFIAQDVEPIIPEVVTTNPDGYKGISYEKLVPVLVEGVKEQQEQINGLLNKIELLENEVKLLKEARPKYLPNFRETPDLSKIREISYPKCEW